MAECKPNTNTEELMIMEQTWDSLCHNNHGLEFPDLHREVLSNRRKALDSGDASFITLEKLKSRFRK